jgi:hypothetical protein
MKIQKIKISELKELVKEKNLLEFNRDIQPRHVEKMIKSVTNCGLLRLPIIGDISKFDSRKLVIIDGQHLCSALTLLDPNNAYHEVNCIVKEYDNKAEVIRDIAKLNNTQKTWNDEDYLYAWVKFGKDNIHHYADYSDLYNQYQNFEGIPCAFLIDLFAKNKDDFKEGRLEFRDRDFSMRLLQICYKLKVDFNKPSQTLHGLRLWAFERYFRDKREIDFVKLESRLFDSLRNNKAREFSNREEFREFVQTIYTKI